MRDTHVMTRGEVGDFLGVSADLVSKLVKVGRLPKPVQVGSRWMFRWETLKTWLDQNGPIDLVLPGADHLVYFIKAKRRPWVKIGRSRDVLSLDRRVKTIVGREPFECELVGVSTSIEEKKTHFDLQEFRIRAEWFTWNRDVWKYSRSVCDLFHRDRDVETSWSSWDEIVLREERLASRKRTQEIAEIVWSSVGRNPAN